MVSDGWLMNPEQNQIILTIQGRALTFYKKKHECEKYRIKVVPMDVRHREVVLLRNLTLFYFLGFSGAEFRR